MLGGVGQLMRPSLVEGDYVAPGILLPPFTLTRAQPGGAVSTALGSDGTTWAEFGADVPRFNGTARRLLIGGARTNQNTNPRGEGGSGTTMPTGWTPSFGALAITSVTPTTRNGIPGVALRFAGTPSSTGGQSVQQFGNTDVVAIGTSVVNAAYFELLAGTLTNVSGFTIRCNTEAGGTVFTPGAFARIENVRVTTATSSSTQVRWQYGDTVTPVDFTLWIGWPQREHATFASTPVLPPVGSPAASTRGADLISATLASLGIGANGACTVLWSGMIPQAAPAATFPAVVNISDGTANNRFTLFQNASSNDFILARVNGGASATSATVGTQTPGTPFPIGLTINGSGGGSACFNGGTVRTVSGGVTSGLTTFAIGTGSLFGEVARLSILPYAISDAALQAAVAAFPTS